MSVLVCILDKLLLSFDFIETFDELVGKRVYPIVELLAHMHELRTNVTLPTLNECHVRGVVNHRFESNGFDLLVLLHVVLVLLVHVDKAVLIHHAEEAPP